MSRDNLELAERAFSAFNRGEIPRVLDMLSPDVEIYASPELANAGSYRGHDGFLAWLERWLDAWESFRVEVDDYIAEGDDVIVVIRQYGRGKGSGLEVQMDAAFMLTVRDGKAVRLHLYPDKGKALQAIAQPE